MEENLGRVGPCLVLVCKKRWWSNVKLVFIRLEVDEAGIIIGPKVGTRRNC